MSEEDCCPQCGAPMGADAPEGLCPACLVRLVASSPAGLTQAETETVLVPAGDEPSLKFGRYTTIRMLGEGGMGIVYLARQDEPIQRTVALKVIKPGLDTQQVIRRFESERQALALMDHPNIARVFDAGAADDGRPYFVMEYVEGVPITEYCDANRLNNRERLDLFRQVCLAVHHAHQKGIIHRDIKPSNVLVVAQDSKPVPKVIDFGVAKAINQRITERTMFTQHGLLVGTPEYMSPEQADIANTDVDSSSDIYSLGMLLYELLAGALPFDWKRLRRAGYLEMMRIIREEEATPLHSMFKTMGAPAAEVAKRRNTDTVSLERNLHGDLEWITMRAIEKDRKRRYASASELAADVERHLNDEPVAAGPPSRIYKLGKFVRKNRLPVAAAAAVLVCLIAGLTSSTILYFREQEQRDRAERESYLANLSNADASIEASEYGAARERLFRCAPRLRGWEWRMVFAQTDTSITRLQAKGDPYDIFPAVRHFAFNTKTGRVYYTMKRTVHAWDMTSWQSVGDFGVFGEILGMSGDGSRVVSKTEGTGLFVMEPATGRTVVRLTDHPGAGWAAFSPDGSLVATISRRDGSVHVSEATSGKSISATPPGRGTLPCLVFSPDGRRIAAFEGRTAIQVLDVRTGKAQWRREISNVMATSLAFSPDGNSLAAAQLDEILILDARTGDTRTKWKEGAGVGSLQFSPDGTRLLTAGRKGNVCLWDVIDGTRMGTLSGHHQARTVAFSPGGELVLAADFGGEITVWQAATYGGSIIARTDELVRSVASSPDGRSVAAVTGDRLLVLDAITPAEADGESTT